MDWMAPQGEPSGPSPVYVRWVFDIKRNKDGSVARAGLAERALPLGDHCLRALFRGLRPPHSISWPIPGAGMRCEREAGKWRRAMLLAGLKALLHCRQAVERLLHYSPH